MATLNSFFFKKKLGYGYTETPGWPALGYEALDVLQPLPSVGLFLRRGLDGVAFPQGA